MSTKTEKIKIGVSSCLIGTKCNFNGTDLLSRFVQELENHNEIELVAFCPEHSVFGTPRPNLRIVGGDGFDVLEGRAVVKDENNLDVTKKHILGAQQFLEKLQSANIKYAILMEGSPSCGSQVLLKEENWPNGGFKKGIGVTAALLKKNRIKIFSNFDEQAMSIFLSSTLNNYQAIGGLKNLKDISKFKTLFG